jgi:hypothetical protein
MTNTSSWEFMTHDDENQLTVISDDNALTHGNEDPLIAPAVLAEPNQKLMILRTEPFPFGCCSRGKL